MSGLDACIADVVGPTAPRSTAPLKMQRSVTAALLLNLFAWGLLPAALVQRIAEAIVEDIKALGVEPQHSLLRMASIGTCGENSQNARRDLFRWLRPVLKYVPQTLRFRIPCVHARSSVRHLLQHVMLPLMYPNLLLESLYRFHPAYFARLLGNGLEEFWGKIKPNDPSLVGNPMCSKPNWRKRAIPIVLHGDGVSFTRNGNSLLVVSMSFLLAAGWSWHSTFMLACFPKFCRAYASLHGVGTWDRIWEYLLHGFIALHDGIHPLTDPFGGAWPAGSFAAKVAGTLLCGGKYFGQVWLLSQDAEYACNELKWPHYSCANKVCGHCPVTSHEHRDYRILALFKTLLFQPGPTDTRVSSHAIWSIPGVTRFSYRGDEMHGLALGPLLWLHASAMWSMMLPGENVCGRGKVEAKVNMLWSKVVAAYIHCGVEKRLTTLTVGMVGKTPHLPQLSCHAMEARHLVRPMLHMFDHLGRNTEHDGHVIECYKYLQCIYKTLEDTGLFLTDEECNVLRSSWDKFLLHYNWLTQWAKGRGLTLYKTTTKHHGCWHMFYFAQFLSPRASWTYCFEDFIGKIKRMGRATVEGTPMHNVPAKIFENYSIAMADQLGIDLTEIGGDCSHLYRGGWPTCGCFFVACLWVRCVPSIYIYIAFVCSVLRVFPCVQ